uniref:NADH-ubiquinone oxidoreductase chain 5 n=1 Tax=Blanus cinereus TaxID=227091 RepID=B7SN20_BLACI|nr:NADH dehydrogenase subunit 5 [Blanus cinereus]ABZ79350.1 NADH dehydrogenase subunit 5 [Blanus cinereus]
MHSLTHAAIITTMTILLMPVLKMLTKMPTTNTTIVLAVKLAFWASLIQTVLMLNTGMDHTIISMTWFNLTNLPLNLNLMWDIYTLTFTPTALFVTWAIMEFAQWYMTSDPDRNKFFKYLLIFLLAMFTLISTNNLFQLFIGWEGVGIMSFLLIGWWYSRTDANTAALQAIIYNRIGDIGLLISLAWLATTYSSWNTQELFSPTQTNFLLPLLGFILAATGKSAQFGLHPWLPAAMEGPTPVSALLHSSTMVVAGIFLLIRINPLMQHEHLAHTVCLCLGGLTSLFASLCALTQNDIKKIIAFSTTSQLGLMMVTIGLNEPKLAFLHMLTHAFFKAMLFLCSGIIIHTTQDEQDIRKMGSLHKTIPITSSCMTIGNMALMGTPFLSGFFSKDAIIEAMTNSHLNTWALTITTIATALTAAYSTRMIFFTQMNTPRFQSLTQMTETSTTQINPIIRLASGTMISGTLLIALNISTKPQIHTMPMTAKLLAIMVTGLALIITLQLVALTNTQRHPKKTMSMQFSTQLAFFNPLTHRTTTKITLTSSQTLATHLNDQAWLETLGPKALSLINTMTTSLMSQAHLSLIKTYLILFLLTMTTALLLKI